MFIGAENYNLFINQDQSELKDYMKDWQDELQSPYTILKKFVISFIKMVVCNTSSLLPNLINNSSTD